MSSFSRKLKEYREHDKKLSCRLFCTWLIIVICDILFCVSTKVYGLIGLIHFIVILVSGILLIIFYFKKHKL